MTCRRCRPLRSGTPCRSGRASTHVTVVFWRHERSRGGFLGDVFGSGRTSGVWILLQSRCGRPLLGSRVLTGSWRGGMTVVLGNGVGVPVLPKAEHQGSHGGEQGEDDQEIAGDECCSCLARGIITDDLAVHELSLIHI